MISLAVAMSCAGPAADTTLGQWSQRWAAVLDIVPPLDQLADPPAEQTCSQVLGDLRAARAELPPAPDPVVDRETDAWFDFAEHTFFECFDTSPAAAYRHLQRLQTQVTTALEGAATEREVRRDR